MFSLRASLGERLKQEENSGMSNMDDAAVGSKQVTFTLKQVNTFRALTSTFLYSLIL